MKKQLITLVILLISFNVFAQYTGNACQHLPKNHAQDSLKHDYYTQYNNLVNIGFTIWTVDEGYMPAYTQAQMDSFFDQPYYKLLEVLGYGGPYITATNVLTVPIECIDEGGYGNLITKISRLSDELEVLEMSKEWDIDETSRQVVFKMEGQEFEWEVELEGKYIDESFVHFLQEIVLNYTNTDRGQLCWFVSPDEKQLVFMWLTPEQMKFMNEVLHLHRIVFD